MWNSSLIIAFSSIEYTDLTPFFFKSFIFSFPIVLYSPIKSFNAPNAEPNVVFLAPAPFYYPLPLTTYYPST
jgi:hypothetical protein